MKLSVLGGPKAPANAIKNSFPAVRRASKTSHRIACNCNKFAAIKLLNGAQTKRRENGTRGESEGKNVFLPNQKLSTTSCNSPRWFLVLTTTFFIRNNKNLRKIKGCSLFLSSNKSLNKIIILFYIFIYMFLSNDRITILYVFLFLNLLDIKQHDNSVCIPSYSVLPTSCFPL